MVSSLRRGSISQPSTTATRVEILRSERERLIEEKQQLMLKREQAFAPARLALEARALGLKPIEASQVGTQKPGSRSQPPLAPALLNPSASLQR